LQVRENTTRRIEIGEKQSTFNILDKKRNWLCHLEGMDK
jgi:hypothetical protein